MHSRCPLVVMRPLILVTPSTQVTGAELRSRTVVIFMVNAPFIQGNTFSFWRTSMLFERGCPFH